MHLAGKLRSGSCRLIGAVILAAVCSGHIHAAGSGLPHAPPEEVGLNAQRLVEIDRIVAEGLRAGRMPGCVVLVGRHGRVALLKAYGDRQVEPAREPMTTDTVFDLASLTKPIGTATSVMILVDRGKLRLDDPVSRHLPEFGSAGKESITALELLTHQGGLVADNPLGDYADGPEEAWRRIFAIKPAAAPGAKFVYSDVGFLVLGKLVERLSGQSLDAFTRQNIFQPLGMAETRYLPEGSLQSRAAPTEKRDGKWLVGEVHDPRAASLGGVAGHAGLFSTADDLAVFAQMMLGCGTFHGVRILTPGTVPEMTRPRRVPGGWRAAGWDVRSRYSTNRGTAFSQRAFGHGGFTGTSLWIDPELDLFVIFLSNRLHPDGKGSVNVLAGQIGTIAVDAIDRESRVESGSRVQSPESRDSGSQPSTLNSQPSTLDPQPVLTGIDVLKRDGFRQLDGRRVGLITNQTGVDRRGVSTARLLAEAKPVRLVALFSPEHGPSGTLEASRIKDSRDAATGLPVYSLYGETRKPTPESLAGIDTLVFDIQDIGTRFYTYISTMGLAMQAAAEHGIRFVVLDRPNPIGGHRVAGPVLDAGRESFVGFHTLPVRHGMTAGELARMFNAELHLELDLEVVELEGWRRDQLFDETGLTWINPSPNMRSLTEALLYPGIGLLETTNLSVGRGTETPFEILGAPWLDGERLARALTAAGLPGVAFRAVRFTPTASKFRGQSSGGVRITVTDRAALEPVRIGLQIAHELQTLYPQTWEAPACDRLLANRRVLDALLAGKPVAELEKLYSAELQEFLRRRARYLLYD